MSIVHNRLLVLLLLGIVFILIVPSSALSQSSPPISARAFSPAFRRSLLSNPGHRFSLKSPSVSFGTTATLKTPLLSPDSPADRLFVNNFLSSASRVTNAIWDPSLASRVNSTTVDLQLLDLNFLTLSLSPTVTVDARIRQDADTGDNIYELTSLSFAPNLRVLPGLGVTSAPSSLQIDCVGQLRPSRDGRSIFGAIAFEIEGNLGSALMLVPRSVMEKAARTLTEKVLAFAEANFVKGVEREVKRFREDEVSTLMRD